MIKNLNKFKKWINENSKNAHNYDWDNLKWLAEELTSFYCNNGTNYATYELSRYESIRGYTVSYTFDVESSSEIDIFTA